MIMQVAAVTKPLGSVRAFVKAGNRVTFDDEDSFIENKSTGAKTATDDRNGAYVFDVWIPWGSREEQQPVNAAELLDPSSPGYSLEKARVECFMQANGNLVTDGLWHLNNGTDVLCDTM